jgi:hypothetical protein
MDQLEEDWEDTASGPFQTALRNVELESDPLKRLTRLTCEQMDEQGEMVKRTKVVKWVL